MVFFAEYSRDQQICKSVGSDRTQPVRKTNRKSAADGVVVYGIGYASDLREHTIGPHHFFVEILIGSPFKICG